MKIIPEFARGLNKTGQQVPSRAAPVLLAAARTSRVLPQPGGPYSRTPLEGRIPRRRKASGRLSGHSMARKSFRFTSSRPPMELKGIFSVATQPRPAFRPDGIVISTHLSMVSHVPAHRNIIKPKILFLLFPLYTVHKHHRLKLLKLRNLKN